MWRNTAVVKFTLVSKPNTLASITECNIQSHTEYCDKTQPDYSQNVGFNIYLCIMTSTHWVC